MVGAMVVRAVCLWLAVGTVLAETERPIIGVVAQELTPEMEHIYPTQSSFIVASYVKAIESSGARVVPVFIGQSKGYYTKLFQSINGLVIPGGASSFSGSNDYYSTGKIMYQLAMKANAEGDYFPILGVCLGYELILYVANNNKKIRKGCDVKNVNLPLEFQAGFKDSSLYRNASETVIKTLQTANVTVNWHKWCIYPADIHESGLDDDWKILSLSSYPTLKSSEPFVSSVEHKQFPVAGIQFHPEKNSFEWSAKKNYPHTSEAIEASRHFYDWIVGESRKNNHSFANPRDESESLIFNYSPTYSDKADIIYTQMYLFKNSPASRTRRRRGSKK